jgi:hypothetical protein
MAVTVYTEGAYPSDWLKREEDSGYSREQVTLLSGSNAAGEVTKSGTILGKITASGKYKPQTLAAADGSQVAAGILWTDTDASASDKRAVVIRRDAIVMQYGLTYGTDVTTSGNRATVNGQLETLGILVREGA